MHSFISSGDIPSGQTPFQISILFFAFWYSSRVNGMLLCIEMFRQLKEAEHICTSGSNVDLTSSPACVTQTGSHKAMLHKNALEPGEGCTSVMRVGSCCMQLIVKQNYYIYMEVRRMHRWPFWKLFLLVDDPLWSGCIMDYCKLNPMTVPGTLNGWRYQLPYWMELLFSFW